MFALHTCDLCGRERDIDKKYCDYCSSMICEICNRKLARGYCAICGKLVCEEDSEMIGFARICLDCLKSQPELRNYNNFKKYLASKSRLTSFSSVQLTKVFSRISHKFRSDPVYIHIGIDDTDSPYGMCTTYLGALLFERLLEIGDPVDYPLLIRLNPNIPAKTRGNGAVALRFRTNLDKFDSVREITVNLISSYSHAFFGKTSPALIIYITDEFYIDKNLYEIYLNSIRDVTPFSYLNKKLKGITHGNIEIYATKTNSRGIIGATAAIGAVLSDFTYELLVYRKKERLSSPRFIDANSVYEMDKIYASFTFDNIDDGRLLIAPVGPDPVLFGIRGDYPDKILEAFKILRHEDFSLWALFRSNQGTHGHVVKIDSPNEARPHQTIMLPVVAIDVTKKEDTLFINAVNAEWSITGRIFKMQRELQHYAKHLMEGDKILVIGSVHSRQGNKLILNIEEFITINLQPEVELRNPICPFCGSRLKKKSKYTYFCPSCRKTFPHLKKLVILHPRKGLLERKRYESPPRAHRHLTLPSKRLIFRARKLSGLDKPYLIYPMIGRSKNFKPRYIGEIRELSIR